MGDKTCPVCGEKLTENQTVCSEECYTALLEREERGPQ